MIKKLVYVSILTFAAQICLLGQVPARWDCTLARDQFTEINNRLLNSQNPTAEQDPKSLKSRTQTLENFITQVVIARLSDVGDANAIKSYLACMQERDGERPWSDVTDAPQVFITRDAQPEIAVTAMLLMRGGSGIPDTRANLQCFAKNSHNWIHVGDLPDADAFNGHTMYISPLHSPIAGEEWYLLSGRVLGGTHAQLRLEVVSCSAKEIRTVWIRDGIIWGKVEVQPNSVLLTYAKKAEEGKALPADQQLGPGAIIYGRVNSDPIQFSEALRVTKNGLEP